MCKIFQSILITGASSGIGAALAEEYAMPGVTLFLMGRNHERLNNIAKICSEKGAVVHHACIDVTSRKEMDAKILEWDKISPIHLVIANAGISQKGNETREQVENVLNINGVINTIYPLIERMKKRKHGSATYAFGSIAIMSSMAGFRGIPYAASYSASKNAVRALGDALRSELKENGIDVTVICPGFIKTPLTDENPFPMPFLMTAEKSAKIIKDGIKKKKKRIMFPWQMRLLVWFISSMPVEITDFIVTKSAKRKRKK